MPNALGMGLLPYNNAGKVDPFANAMAGGLGQMYAIQQQQADARDSDQAFLSKLNDYQNTIADNPNKQGARDLLNSAQGIMKDQYASGDMAINRNAALAADTEESNAKVSKAKEAQHEQATSEAMRINEELKAAGALGGNVAQQEVWKTKAIPMLVKMGRNPDPIQTATPENISKFAAMTDSMQQSLSFAQKLALVTAGNQTKEDVARIAADARRETSNARPPSMSQYIASIKAKPAELRTKDEQDAIDKYDQVQAASIFRTQAGVPSAKIADIRVLELKQKLADKDLSANERKDLLESIKILEEFVPKSGNSKETKPATSKEPSKDATSKLPPGSIPYGKTPEGKPVYKSPDGKLWVD